MLNFRNGLLVFHAILHEIKELESKKSDGAQFLRKSHDVQIHFCSCVLLKVFRYSFSTKFTGLGKNWFLNIYCQKKFLPNQNTRFFKLQYSSQINAGIKFKFCS